MASSSRNSSLDDSSGSSCHDSTNDKDTISVRVSSEDVDIVVEGAEVAVVPDLDLKLEIPRSKFQRKPLPLRNRMLGLLRRLKGGTTTETSRSHVMLIRDTVAVRDAQGRLYDMEMDLKVEVDSDRIEEKKATKAKTLPFSWMRRSVKNVNQVVEEETTKPSLSATKSLDFFDLNDDVISAMPAGLHSLNHEQQHFQQQQQQPYSLPYMTRSTSDLFRFTTV